MANDSDENRSEATDVSESARVDREPPTNATEPEVTHSEAPEPVVVMPAEGMKKKSHKKRNIFVAVLLVVLLVGGGAAAYYLNRPEPVKEQATVKKEARATIKEDTTVAEALVSEIRNDIGGQLVSEGNTSPPYKPDGYGYYVRSSTEYEAKVERIKDKAENALQAIRNKLIEKGYTESVTQDVSDSGMYEADFTGTYALCYVYMISGLNAADPKGSSAGLTCADIESYETTAKQMEPFATAYEVTSSYSSAEPTLYTNLRASKSSVSGYERATVGISGIVGAGGFAGLFYKTPSMDWKFFTGTQEIVPCDAYSTDDIKKAYLGEPCYDQASDNQTTVKL